MSPSNKNGHRHRRRSPKVGGGVKSRSAKITRRHRRSKSKSLAGGLVVMRPGLSPMRPLVMRPGLSPMIVGVGGPNRRAIRRMSRRW